VGLTGNFGFLLAIGTLNPFSKRSVMTGLEDRIDEYLPCGQRWGSGAPGTNGCSATSPASAVSDATTR
jgi:hypothetical protein